MSDKIRKYVLPNLPYLFVFWFFSKIGTAYRIAPGTDFGTKLMGMLDTFPKAFETYWPGLGGIDLLVGLAGAAGVYLLIQSKIRQNYFRSLFAVGFQGLLILVCVAIYAVLIQSIATDGDPIGAIWGCVGYTVLLCFTLFKTGSLAKSIFGCH